jgi:general stress protein 26
MLIKAKTKPEQAFSTVINELKKGSVDSRHPYRYVSLATFNPDREESNIRMLINREIKKDGTLTLYTDSRTEKVKELKALQKSALLFWHDHHKVQVTLKAEVAIHHNDEVAEDYWKSDVHGAAQKAYTPLVAPGTNIDRPAEAHSWPGEFSSENFCVLKCIPYEIEILQLAGKEHLRLKFKRDGDGAEWEGGWIAP